MIGYLLSPLAEADFEDIWNYTVEHWSLSQAETYHGDLMSAIARLANDPKLGRDCSHIRPGYVRYNVGAHTIFYIVQTDAIHVMRILHKSRDFPRHL